jgi:PPM family protein phosphatase
MEFQFVGRTDVGCKRPNNEDFFTVSEMFNLAIVCDGMGGHEGGDVASRTIAETMVESFHRMTDDQMRMFSRFVDPEFPAILKRLYFSARLANLRLLRKSDESGALKGMGTTLVAAAFFRGNSVLVNVGDSRCYRIRDEEIRQLTTDHSYVQSLYAQGDISEEQKENFKKKNILTRALGMSETIKLDVSVEPVRKGDLFLLCTDGLWGKVPDARILEVVLKSQGRIEEAADRLVQDAIERGGDDNITVVLARCRSLEEPLETFPPLHATLEPAAEEVRTYQSALPAVFAKRRRVLAFLAAGLVILSGAAWGVWKSVSDDRSAGSVPPAPKAVQSAARPRQMVYFTEVEDPRIAGAVLIVDGKEVGTLDRIGEGRSFEIGPHEYALKLDSQIVRQGRFECVPGQNDPSNLVDLNAH